MASGSPLSRHPQLRVLHAAGPRGQPGLCPLGNDTSGAWNRPPGRPAQRRLPPQAPTHLGFPGPAGQWSSWPGPGRRWPRPGTRFCPAAAEAFAGGPRPVRAGQDERETTPSTGRGPDPPGQPQLGQTDGQPAGSGSGPRATHRLGRRVVDPDVGPREGPVEGGHMDALSGGVQQLHPGLGQGLGSRAACCRPQVLGDALHEDEPAEGAPGVSAGVAGQPHVTHSVPVSKREAEPRHRGPGRGWTEQGGPDTRSAPGGPPEWGVGAQSPPPPGPGTLPSELLGLGSCGCGGPWRHQG